MTALVSLSGVEIWITTRTVCFQNGHALARPTLVQASSWHADNEPCSMRGSFSTADLRADGEAEHQLQAMRLVGEMQRRRRTLGLRVSTVTVVLNRVDDCGLVRVWSLDVSEAVPQGQETSNS